MFSLSRVLEAIPTLPMSTEAEKGYVFDVTPPVILKKKISSPMSGSSLTLMSV